jgi:hypothetical protein
MIVSVLTKDELLDLKALAERPYVSDWHDGPASEDATVTIPEREFIEFREGLKAAVDELLTKLDT